MDEEESVSRSTLLLSHEREQSGVRKILAYLEEARKEIRAGYERGGGSAASVEAIALAAVQDRAQLRLIAEVVARIGEE